MAGKTQYMVEVKCPRCEKIFMATTDWVYRANHHYFCSWTCYQKTKYPSGVTKREEKPRPTLHYYKRPVLQYTPDGKFIRRWESIKACADGLGVSSSDLVSRACTGVHKTCMGYVLRFESKERKEGEDLNESSV